MKNSMTGRLLRRFLLAVGLLGWATLTACESTRTAPDTHAVSPGDQEDTPSDPYGGIAGPVSEPTGFFHVKKVGQRWMFITPQGNPFWMLGVFHVDTGTSADDRGESYSDRILRKYGDKYKWGEHTARRLKSWGFNTLGEYSTWYVLPTDSPYAKWSNPEKMPLVGLVRPAHYSLRNTNNWAQGPVKDLVAGTDAHYRGYRGATSPDIWDPNFDMWLDNALQKDPNIVAILNSPWLIGMVCDDTDNLWGFGAGPDFPTEPPGHANPHLGWIILITSDKQTSNADLGVTYSDPRLYSKYALTIFLSRKYGSIQALNAAWRSSYTTFDSDGGWPNGRGLLDENGKGAWVGTDPVELRDAHPQVKADLDEFLLEHAEKYFSIVRTRIKQHASANLYLGPTVIGSWGVPARKEILQAAGRYVDVIHTHYNGSQETLDFMARYAGDLPIASWQGTVANPDSSLFRYKAGDGPSSFNTQAERSQFYANQLLTYFGRAVTATGIKPIVGIKLWEFADNWGEKTNWGLVTFSDNAYDGREAVKAAGTDPWGYLTGGEERDYGDFLGEVSQANRTLRLRLRAEAEGWTIHVETQRIPGRDR